MSNLKTFVVGALSVATVTSVAVATFFSRDYAAAAQVPLAESMTVVTTELPADNESQEALESTDWYYETAYGSYIVDTEYGQFETLLHPTEISFQSSVILDLSCNSCVDESFDAETFMVNKSYYVPREFYYDTLPEEMHCLVEGICTLEETQEISSMFLFAVAATEVGWDPVFVGDNNWFNWTPDAESYMNFSSVDECIQYTGRRFQECFFNPEWYALFDAEVDTIFTIDEINSRYAFFDDGTVNTYWSDVVSEILESFHIKYKEWVINNEG